MSENNIMVSIVCCAYNHEKYIREALEGFVSQKTDFRYEVIVHDDASTDNTADVIREYAEKYPELIRPILQTKNLRTQKISMHKYYTAPAVRGKYVALCEGDDYWIDPYKLQKQFDVMEVNEDCTMCVHKNEKIKEDGTRMGEFMPSIDIARGKIDTQGFLDIQKYYPFQTATYFMRADIWKGYIDNPPEFRKVSDVGDEPMLLFMVAKGYIYYIPDCMSCYRICSIGSWSEKNKNNSQKRIAHIERMYQMMCLYDEFTDHKFDCHLHLFRGRMFLYNKNFKELLKKENKPYLRQLSFKKRLFVYIASVFPVAGKLIK